MDVLPLSSKVCRSGCPFEVMSVCHSILNFFGNELKKKTNLQYSEQIKKKNNPKFTASFCRYFYVL